MRSLLSFRLVVLLPELVLVNVQIPVRLRHGCTADVWRCLEIGASYACFCVFLQSFNLHTCLGCSHLASRWVLFLFLDPQGLKTKDAEGQALALGFTKTKKGGEHVSQTTV